MAPIDPASEAPLAREDIPRSLPQAFLRTVDRNPEQLAAIAGDDSLVLTWTQLRARTRDFAAGLSQLGVGPGSTVGVMLKNRPEFMLADLAIMCLGAAPFSIYATLPIPQIVPILDNSDAETVICEQAFLPLVQGARAAGARLKHIIVLEGGTEGTMSWSDVEASGAQYEFDFDASVHAIRPGDLAAIVYTSGTTGPAKGVELEHRAALALAQANGEFLRSKPDDRYLSWLPTAGMAERATSHFGPLVMGGTVYFCDDPRLAAQALPKAKPSVFFAPPRFWEKVREAIEAQWTKLDDEPRQRIRDALARQYERVKLEQAGTPVGQALADECKQSDAALFRPIRERLGLGTKDIYVCSGGAAASRGLLEFYSAIGLPLDEVYGQTESSALGTRSPRGRLRMGAVGVAQPGVEIKLAADGEILIRSPAVMRGYRKDPKATAAAKDSDGWLHTGDIGTVDADGYFRIVDRKKEMIINSFGKNMSPTNIESALTSAGSFISQAVVIGEARNYNVALLTLDSAYVSSWAQRNGFSSGVAIEQVKNDPRLIQEVQAEVDRANAQLSRVEQIKKFSILGGEWVPGSPEMTPTMKLKRRVINERYADIIDSLYASAG